MHDGFHRLLTVGLLLNTIGMFAILYSRRYLPADYREGFTRKRFEPIWRLRRHYTGRGEIFYWIGAAFGLAGLACLTLWLSLYR